MTVFQKYSISFGLALALHLTILGLFGLSFSDETELVKHKPLPEIIQASMLDDEKIQLEAERLKRNESNKKLTQKNKQREIEQQRKKEQALLNQAKKQRIKEQKKAKALEKKNKQLALKEKQRLKKIKSLKAKEAARLAKIKEQKIVEKKRQDKIHKAKQKKQQLEKIAEQERQKAVLAKQKADAVAKAAALEKQAAAVKAKAKSDRQATISLTAAIQQKVNNRWIKPLSARNGLQCSVRVKLLPSGDVMEATVLKGSGDAIFDRSAENAVLKASPLPVPKDRALFTRKFRTFTFVFKPE